MHGKTLIIYATDGHSGMLCPDLTILFQSKNEVMLTRMHICPLPVPT